MDFPTLFIYMISFSFLGTSGVFFIFISFFDEFMSANRIAPDGAPRFAASHLGLFCLPLSHKKDARLIYFIFYFWSFEISRNILRNRKILYV